MAGVPDSATPRRWAAAARNGSRGPPLCRPAWSRPRYARVEHDGRAPGPRLLVGPDLGPGAQPGRGRERRPGDRAATRRAPPTSTSSSTATPSASSGTCSRDDTADADAPSSTTAGTWSSSSWSSRGPSTRPRSASTGSPQQASTHAGPDVHGEDDDGRLVGGEDPRPALRRHRAPGGATARWAGRPTRRPRSTLTRPAEGAVFGDDQVVTSDFACTATDHPIASCVGYQRRRRRHQHRRSRLATATRSPPPTSRAYSTTRTTHYTVVDDDLPTIAVTSPQDGLVVARGSDLVADFACADPGGAMPPTGGCVGSVGTRPLPSTPARSGPTRSR